MTLQDQKRLAHIHAQWQAWSAVTDTSSWEVTFFLKVLALKNEELNHLKKLAIRASKPRLAERL